MKCLMFLVLMICAGCVSNEPQKASYSDSVLRISSPEELKSFFSRESFILVLRHRWSIESLDFAIELSEADYFSTPRKLEIGYYTLPDADEELSNFIELVKANGFEVSSDMNFKIGGGDGAVIYKSLDEQGLVSLRDHLRSAEKLVELIEERTGNEQETGIGPVVDN